MEKNVDYPPNCKAIVVDEKNSVELSKNLKTLAESLQAIESSRENQYTALAKHLIHVKLVRHSSKEVRLFCACCLVDLLRICAPENPFNKDADLKELISFFIRVLRGLEDIEGSSYHRYFYVLECLAVCKSFLLIAKLRSSETAITLTGKLFNLFFQVVSESHMGKARSLMLEVMSSLVNQTNCMDNEILELIYQHILPPFKHQKPCAYSLAADLLRLTSNAIESHVLNFFNDVLSPLNEGDADDSFITPSKTPRSSSKNGGESDGTRKRNSLTVQRIYDLMYEVYATAPATLSSVLPLIEMKLKSLEVDDRLLAVQCLGKMFGHENSQLYLDNQNLWSGFLSRCRDASAEVRMKFLKCVPAILEHHNEDIGPDVTSALSKLARDTSSDLRKETMKVIEQIGFVSFSLVNSELLALVRDRTRDTNWAVRKAAMNAGANWYHQLCSLSSSSSAEITGSEVWSQNSPRVKLSWVVPKLLANYLSTDAVEKSYVDELLFSKVFADYYSNSDISSVRFLEIFLEVDDQSFQVLQKLLKYDKLLTKIGFSGKIGEDLIANICAFLMRPDKSDFNRNYYYKDEILDPKLDERDLRNSFDDNDSLFAISSSDDKKLRALLMVECLFYAYPDLFTSVSCVEHLERFLRFAIIGRAKVTCDVLKHVLKSLAIVCKYVQEKTKENNNEEEIMSEEFNRAKNSLLESSNSILEHSNDAKLCKYSVILCCGLVTESVERTSMFSKLFKKLTGNISLTCCNLLGILGATTQLAFAGAFELHNELQKFISAFVTKKLLASDISDLKEDDQDKLICAKVYGLKLITRWLLGLKGSNLRLAESSLKMFATGIINGGSFSEPTENNSGPPEVEKEYIAIRLTAAKMMLKLSTLNAYANIISADQFNVVASVILDPLEEVRASFAAKLDKHFMAQKLPLKFLAIFAFCGREPNSDLKEKLHSYLKRNLAKRKQILKNTKIFQKNFEVNASVDIQKIKRQSLFSNLDDVMLYVVHLLAHFHEFDSLKNLEVLKALKDCVWFVLQILMYDLDHFSYTYHKFMLDSLKNCQDATTESGDKESNEKLYAVCDLALTLLNARVKLFDSISISELNLSIPTKLYRVIEDGKRMNSKLYIPASLTEKPKTILDSSAASSLAEKNKKKQKVKHLIKDDARSEDSKDADEAGSKSRRKQQTKISDHVVTSFMAPKNKIGDKRGKKKFNLSSTEEDDKQKDGRESELSEDNDTGSPDFKCRISGSRKRGRPEQASKSDQSEDEDDRKVYFTRTRNSSKTKLSRFKSPTRSPNTEEDNEKENEQLSGQLSNSPSSNKRTPSVSRNGSRGTPANTPKKDEENQKTGRQEDEGKEGQSKTRPSRLQTNSRNTESEKDHKSTTSSTSKSETKHLMPDKKQSKLTNMLSGKSGRNTRTSALMISSSAVVEPELLAKKAQQLTPKDFQKSGSKKSEVPITGKRVTRTRGVVSEYDESDTSKASQSTPKNKARKIQKLDSTPSSDVNSPASLIETGTPSNRTRNRMKSVAAI